MIQNHNSKGGLDVDFSISDYLDFSDAEIESLARSERLRVGSVQERISSSEQDLAQVSQIVRN